MSDRILRRAGGLGAAALADELPDDIDLILRDAHGRPPDAIDEFDPQQVKTLCIDRIRVRQIEVVADDARLVAHAGSRVAVLSGAGISVDAGFPTFRGATGDGLWEQVDPMVLASVEGYAADPIRSMRWYCSRREIGRIAVPTLAHAAIARAQANAPDRWAGCHTQNVDGLHEAAGSRGVNRVHGSLWCWKDVRTRELIFEPSAELDDIALDERGVPLHRPGVVMFGDMLPTEVVGRALDELSRCDVALIVGTSAAVNTLWPMLHTAEQAGARLVEINPEASPVTTELGALHLRMPSGVGIPLALRALGAISHDELRDLASKPRLPLSASLDRLGPELVGDR